MRTEFLCVSVLRNNYLLFGHFSFLKMFLVVHIFYRDHEPVVSNEAVIRWREEVGDL